MKSQLDSIITKVLAVATAILLTVSLTGCIDPLVADMEAEHLRLGSEAKQELRQYPAAFSSVSQTEALYTAP